jgi:hypothetical protein
MDAGVVVRDRWFCRLRDSSVVGALMAVVDGRCVDVFGEVHPVVILNFGRYQSVISFEMFWIDL